MCENEIKFVSYKASNFCPPSWDWGHSEKCYLNPTCRGLPSLEPPSEMPEQMKRGMINICWRVESEVLAGERDYIGFAEKSEGNLHERKWLITPNSWSRPSLPNSVQ